MTASTAIDSEHIGSRTQRGRRILLVSEVFPPQVGGSGRWFYELYRRFERHQVVYAVGQHGNSTGIDSELGLPVHRFEWDMKNRGLLDFRQYALLIRALMKVTAKESIDEVHAGRVLSEGLLALFLRLRHRIPYRVYVHGEDLSAYRSSRELTWLARRVLKRASCVIANSSYTAEQLAWWGLPSRSIDLLHPGVDTSFFQPAEDTANVRASLGWTDRRVLLTVGRLQRRKGHDVAIEAVAALKNRHPDLMYVIVGDGDERDRLKSLVAQWNIEDRVVFITSASDDEMLHAYQACDFFALPNRSDGHDVEGFGIVLLEAQACGKPVIAGASGGTRDAMQDGVTGRLIDCSDSSALTATLDRWLSSPKDPSCYASKARAFACKFSWSELAKEAESQFDTAV